MPSLMAQEPESGITLDDERPSDSPPTAGRGRGLGSAPTIEGELTEESARGDHTLEDIDVTMVPRAHYEFRAEVARGGLGRIYQALDRRLHRVVAIKELLRPSNASRARFLREIDVTVRLEHPNIVAIHEAGKWPDGKLFYAMNYVAGQTLLEAIAATESLDERLGLLSNVITVAEAMAYAHSEGVIHRDLKPANILVGPFGETVVIDWGLAKHTTQSETTTSKNRTTQRGLTVDGGVVGTPPYMAPEQAAGETADKRSDVYALGAILYHLLSGREPYSQYASEQLLETIARVPPISLQDLEPDVPADLSAIVDKAMAREPAKRYPDAHEMMNELLLFTRGRMVGAYDYSLVDLARRWMQRHIAAVSTAAVALVALLLLASTMVYRIRAERDIATVERDRAQERAEALIVSQARALTGSDPTLAVARLMGLTTQARGAPSVAARSEELGVARWVLRGHEDSIRCLGFSPDGKTILSGSSDKTLRLWSPGNGPPLVLTGHEDQVATCSFSPDGKVIASAGYDSRVIIWDAASGDAMPLPAQKEAIKALAFSSDGQRLFSACEPNGLRAWDTGSWTSKDYDAPNARWPQLSVDPQSEELLSGPHNGQFRIWDKDGSYRESPPDPAGATTAAIASAGEILLGTRDGRVLRWSNDSLSLVAQLDAEVVALATASSPEAQDFVAAADAKGRVFRIQLIDGIAQLVAQHQQKPQVLSVSANGRFVASGGWDKTVRLADSKTGASRVLRGHGDVVATLAFSPDGQFLASGSWDRSIRVWALREPLHDERRVLAGHQVGVKSARFSSDGKLVVTGGHDNLVRLWEIETGTSEILQGHTDHVFRAIFSPDSRWIASSSDDRTVRLWPVPGRNDQSPKVFEGHEADVEELAFSPDGSLLLSASEDTTARLWQVNTGDSKVLLHDHDVTQVAFESSGKRFATASRSGTIRLFNRRGAELQTYRDHADEAFGLAWHPAGGIASSDLSGRVLLRGSSTTGVESLAGAGHMTFSSDGRWLAVIGARPHLWLCPSQSGLSGANTCVDLDAHAGTVNAVRFTPDSTQLASAGGDGDIHLWDIKLQEYRLYRGHRAAIFDLDISPDGRWLLSASGDETARLWPIIPVAEPSRLQQSLTSLTSARSVDESR